MSADKRIRISEQNRESLHHLKDVGQSYDDVIEELIEVAQEHNRRELFERMDRREKHAPAGFTPLEELDP